MSDLIDKDLQQISCAFPFASERLRKRIAELEAITADLDFEPDENHTVADMANVGKSLMVDIKAYCPDYCWSERPSEIVGDLFERNKELEADNARLRVDAGELWKALNDLSFECCGGIGLTTPTIDTYNRTFTVMDTMRGKYAAKEST